MVNLEREIMEVEKLVEEERPVMPDMLRSEMALTNKRAYRKRKLAGAHIRAHNVKGKLYYYYVRGTDKEVYLGDAAAVLRAVKKGKR